jgi:hypothetical protein
MRFLLLFRFSSVRTTVQMLGWCMGLSFEILFTCLTGNISNVWYQNISLQVRVLWLVRYIENGTGICIWNVILRLSTRFQIFDV